MEKGLEKNKAFDDLCQEIHDAQQSFFRATLRQVVAFKAFLGGRIVLSPIYRSYGEDLIGMISQETGISRKVLEDAATMYKRENLSPGREKKFAEQFEKKFESWNDYREKFLINRTDTILDNKSIKRARCIHCPIHC